MNDSSMRIVVILIAAGFFFSKSNFCYGCEGHPFTYPFQHRVSNYAAPEGDSLLKSRIHIYGKGYRHSTWKYKFTINGMALTLKPGHCMEYLATGDSVKIEIVNNPLMKSQVPVNLNVQAKEELYIFLNSGEPMEPFPYKTFAVKEICKECYDKLSKSCK